MFTYIPDLLTADARGRLLPLDSARRALFQREGKCAMFDQLSKSFCNLLRMWTES